MPHIRYTIETDTDAREYRIDYRITPGERAHGPTYSCGGYPGSPPECEVIGARLVRILDDHGERVPHDIEADDAGRQLVDRLDHDETLLDAVHEACFEHADALEESR